MTHDSASGADASHTSHGADTYTDTSFHHDHSSFNDHSHHHSHHQDNHHHDEHHNHHKHHHHQDLPEEEPLYPPPAYGTEWQETDRREYYEPPVEGNMADMRQVCGRIFIAVFIAAWLAGVVFIVSKGLQMGT